MESGNGGASFDAIVVGGGHNGLTCGAYLARASPRSICAPPPSWPPRQAICSSASGSS
jgi:glycine/D-amino acid oxidase-like deaminating enzyme